MSQAICRQKSYMILWSYDQIQNFNSCLTNHFMQQLTVALSKQNTQIQNFGNVKQEVVVDNFSKHSGGDEVILWKLIVSDQSIYR